MLTNECADAYDSRMQLTHTTLRQFAYARQFSTPTDVQQLGFVQIDPIKAPACAQDLILRQRVAGYRNGDMARAYATLPMEEAFFVNHGYVPRSLAAMLWCNRGESAYLTEHAGQVAAILAYARDNAEVHPKVLNQQLGAKTVANAWGGAGLQVTQTLQRMHHNGLLRIVRRDKNNRVYGLPLETADVSVADMVAAAFAQLVRTYAPLTAASLTYLGRLLAQCRPDAKAQIKLALSRLDDDFASALVDGVRWYWPRDEQVSFAVADTVRLLTPFDPLVWDRARFEYLWGWTYKFEAYKPAPTRQFGYYALPLFWRDSCVGWGNAKVEAGQLQVELGYINGAPSESRYQVELAAELARLEAFLRV
ncbi:MAG: DNA glycosylase AlkZ-like family protein [Formosimonas sp.]